VASNLNHTIPMTEAVQTLEPSTHRYKRGDVREDGLIFWSYTKQGTFEYWLSQEKFLDRKIKQKEILKSNKKKTLDHIIRIYKCGDVREDGRIFLRYDKISKNNECWVTREYFSEFKKKNREYSIRRNKSQERKEYYKRYALENKDHINNYKKGWLNLRISNDNLYAFIASTRTRIGNSLRSNGFDKNSETAKILGCSFEFFKNYIEQRFEEGMNWENRSEWHLDHIIPVSSATTEREIIKLNHYTNFRPLWAKENLAKGKKQNKQLELIK